MAHVDKPLQHVGKRHDAHANKLTIFKQTGNNSKSLFLPQRLVILGCIYLSWRTWIKTPPWHVKVGGRRLPVLHCLTHLHLNMAILFSACDSSISSADTLVWYSGRCKECSHCSGRRCVWESVCGVTEAQRLKIGVSAKKKEGKRERKDILRKKCICKWSECSNTDASG